jgi:hypothetical protein
MLLKVALNIINVNRPYLTFIDRYQMINLYWSLFSLASLPNTFCLYPKCWSLIGQLHIQIYIMWRQSGNENTKISISHNVVSSTPHLNGIRTNNVNNDSTDYICRSKSNCQTITTTTVPQCNLIIWYTVYNAPIVTHDSVTYHVTRRWWVL